MLFTPAFSDHSFLTHSHSMQCFDDAHPPRERRDSSSQQHHHYTSKGLVMSAEGFPGPRVQYLMEVSLHQNENI